MDDWKTVQARQKGAADEILRPPLAPSEKNNAILTHKPRTREVTSRYKASGALSSSLSTPSAPRRCLSPNCSRTVPLSPPGTSASKRAQSAERRRPLTPSSSPSRPSTPVRDTSVEMAATSRRLIGGRTPEGLWPSTRSLSASFQSDTLSLDVVKKEKPTLKTLSCTAHKRAESPAPERKRTPLRGRNAPNQSENSKPIETPHSRVIDHHIWPSRTSAKAAANSLSSSVDLTNKAIKATPLAFSGRGASPVRRTPAADPVNRSSQKFMGEAAKRASFDNRGRTEYGMRTIYSVDDDSLPVTGVPKFVSSSGVSLSSSGGILSITRTIRTQLLPNSEFQRPPSPRQSRPSTPPSSRGMLSPSRARPTALFPSVSTGISRSSSSTSVLSFVADVRKGRKGANHMEDAHQLKLLHNRYLQWRFVNARTDNTLAIQKVTAENVLFSVWFTTSELRNSVTLKRTNLQQLRQEMKLNFILKEQMAYLDGWALVERDHSSSLSGASEALEASTLHLPVTGGARADIYSVKNAVSSAVDVLQAMGSSICSLLLKVEGMNHLVSNLANVAARERALLDECRDLLASMAAMQVEESSLRAHLLQLKQAMHKE